jgi:hypothetical protein
MCYPLPNPHVPVVAAANPELLNTAAVNAPAHGRGQPKKTVPAVSVVEPETFMFDLIINVIKLDRKVHTNGKAKVVKQDPDKHGPIAVDSELSWPEFMKSVSVAMKVPIEYLLTGSWDWQLSTPKNSQRIPVRDEGGFQSVLHSLAAKQGKKKSLPFILLFTEEAKYLTPVSYLSSCKGCLFTDYNTAHRWPSSPLC